MEGSKLKALFLAALVSTILVAVNTHQVNPKKGFQEKIAQSLVGSKQPVDSDLVADPKQAAGLKQQAAGLKQRAAGLKQRATGLKQKVPLILQTNPSNCGLASLAMLLSYYLEAPISLESLERAAATLLNASSARWKSEGFSVGELKSLASAYGITIQAARIDAAKLQTLNFPLLAWIDPGSGGHFTVIQSFEGGEVSLADPTRGYFRIGKALWDRLWLKGATGIVLFVN